MDSTSTDAIADQQSVRSIVRVGSQTSIQHHGLPSITCTQGILAAFILGSLAFVPMYGLGVAFKGYPKMPMIYAGLIGFLVAEYAGRHNVFDLDDEQDK
jgi:hypothetical protein